MNLFEPFEGTIHIEEADMKKLVKALEDINIKDCPYFELSDKYGNSARYYRGNQWIPVSERLPDDYGHYIVCTTQNNVYVARYTSWGSWNGQFKNCVTAWMPLPDPYKGE